VNEQPQVISVDSSFRRHGDSTFTTIVTRKGFEQDTHAIDYIRALAWPMVVLLIAFILKNKISELEGLGLKAKLNLGAPEQQIKDIQEGEKII
jgi:hypothetical protein